MRRLLFILCLPLAARAVTPLVTNPPREKILAKTEITVKNFIEASNAVELIINEQPGVGPNYATPEDLKAALGIPGNLVEFKKRTLRDLGSVFVLRKELVLLWPVELKIRAKQKR